MVTADNGYGVSTYVIPQSEVVKQLPGPSLTDVRAAGGALQGVRTEPGIIAFTKGWDARNEGFEEIAWSGIPEPSLDYTWYRCASEHLLEEISVEPVPEECALIRSTGTQNTYSTVALDLGHHIVGVVTTTNSIGSVSYRSSSRGPIGPSPQIYPTFDNPSPGDRISLSTRFVELGWGSNPIRTWFMCDTDPRQNLLGARPSTEALGLPEDCAEVADAGLDWDFEVTSEHLGKWPLISVEFEPTSVEGDEEAVRIEVASNFAVGPKYG